MSVKASDYSWKSQRERLRTGAVHLNDTATDKGLKMDDEWVCVASVL